ncbi:MAG: UbiA-like polyprenyltransferase [Coriobacteriia bacterium]|nr:UbiA-like polyprenyltransferase [Coriobacteriia bacterium]
MSDAPVADPKKPGKVAVLLELVKFEHSIFALPYAYIGAIYGAAFVERLDPLYELPPQVQPFLALGPALLYKGGGYAWPAWSALLWITVAMVGARAFAFVVNRAVDKEIDARNPRTAGRAIPAGLIKAWELWLFSAVMLAAYLVAVFQLAPVTHWLWPIPLAMFIAYPYLKRFTWACHFWLGACLGLGACGGWAAVGAPLSDPAPWVFAAAVTLWTAGFDIIYATQDYECDVRDGVHSVPADLGIARGLVITRACHALTFLLLLGGGYLVGAGWPYYTGVVIAGILLAYENAIVKADDLSRVNAAFFTTNGVIAIILLAGAVADRFIG